MMKARIYSIGALLVAATVAIGRAQATADDGSKLYSDSCAACHGQKGKGDGPASAGLNPKPVDFANALTGKADDWLEKIISGGGPAVGMAPTMPAFDGAFSADQVHELINYLRTLARSK